MAKGVGSATPTIEKKLTQKRILELRKTGLSIEAIAEEMGFSAMYVRKLYKQALNDIICDDVNEVRRLELAKLDDIQEVALQVMRAFHPLVNSGTVVRDAVEDENGNPVLDENSNPVTTRLADTGPVLAAIDRLIRVSERRSKLIGADAPVKTAMTNPTGDKEASLVQFYIPNNNRDQDQDGQADQENTSA